MTRIVKYDLLRIAACFAIVLLHVSASYWSVVEVHSGEFLTMTVYNSLTRFAVPVFFMLSGLFLVSPERESAGLGRRILKLLVLFYVWSAFYAFQGAVVDTLKGSFSAEVWSGAWQRFVYGHVHMWFLQILIGFYILIPVARRICADRKILRYYLAVWTVFHLILPCMTRVLGLETLQARIDSLGLDLLEGNFGYFLLGYFLDTAQIGKRHRYALYAAGIGGGILTAFLTVWDSRRAGVCLETWFSPAAPNVLVMSAAVFVFFKHCRLFEGGKRARLWAKLSGYTFFVYMFHMFVIEKLNLAGITTVSFPAVVSVPALTVFTFLASLLGAFAADHIPWVRRLVLLH